MITEYNKTANISTNVTSETGVLAGFIPYIPPSEMNEIALTIRKDSITFNEVSVKSLDYTRYCSIMVNEQEMTISILAAETGQEFYKSAEGEEHIVRWSDNKIVREFCKIARLNVSSLPSCGLKFYGGYNEYTNQLLFYMDYYEAY